MKWILSLCLIVNTLVAQPFIGSIANQCSNTSWLDGSHKWGFDTNANLVDEGPVVIPFFVEGTNIWGGFENVIGPADLVSNWWNGYPLTIGKGCIADLHYYPAWGETNLHVTMYWGGVGSTGAMTMQEEGFLVPPYFNVWYIWCYGSWDICSVVNCPSLAQPFSKAHRAK